MSYFYFGLITTLTLVAYGNLKPAQIGSRCCVVKNHVLPAILSPQWLKSSLHLSRIPLLSSHSPFVGPVFTVSMSRNHSRASSATQASAARLLLRSVLFVLPYIFVLSYGTRAGNSASRPACKRPRTAGATPANSRRFWRES